MAFEIQDLPDVIRVIVLLNLSKGTKIKKTTLKNRIDRVCVSYTCVEMEELDKALKEMAIEGLISEKDGAVQLTVQGQKLSKEWESLLLKKEPIMEVVAGLVDGAITSLVVILSAIIATFTGATLLGEPKTLIFAATLSAVAITNFSSFLLGGITADLADIITLQNLMNYSLSDIPDKKERDKSLLLVQKLFTLLSKQIHRSNLFGAIISGTTTFFAGIVPIATYLLLQEISPLNIILAFTEVATISGVFLVRYRSKKTRVNWKVTLVETLVIVIIATVVSLILGAI